MAKNKRLVNTNSDQGSDTVELLNDSSARLMQLENVESPRSLNLRSAPKSRETAELSENVSSKRAGRAKNGKPSVAADPVKTPDTVSESGKRTRAKQSGSTAEKGKPGGSGKTGRVSKTIRSSKTGSQKENGVSNPTEEPVKAVKGSRKKGKIEKTTEKSQNRSRNPRYDAEETDADGSAGENASGQDDPAKAGSCKTRQVMKLIEGDDDNLVVFAGKSRIPSLLRGRESLSVMMRRRSPGVSDYDDTEVVNITELVIRHEAAEILDRFNACSCEKCVNVFSAMIAERIPVRYARISRAELDSGELPERAVPMRQIVLPEMIRQLICNKKRCFHDE